MRVSSPGLMLSLMAAGRRSETAHHYSHQGSTPTHKGTQQSLPFQNEAIDIRPMNIPTLSQWQRGLEIAQQIATLEKELATILGRQAAPPAAKAAPAAKASPKAAPPAKRKLSPQALANIRAAQKKRWSKVKAGQKAPAAPTTKSAPPEQPEPAKAPEKKKRQLSPEVRAKLSAAMKAKWEAAKQSGGPAPTAKKEESPT
jgi:hypothetical protein